MTAQETNGPIGILARPFVLRSKDARFRALFLAAATRPPDGTQKMTSVRQVSLSRRATKTMVGLTRYSRVRYFLLSHPYQTITFYSSLFNSLSGPAETAVIAHELAHAWLNEHVRPEESRSREREADELARDWGFGEELAALDHEAETVND